MTIEYTLPSMGTTLERPAVMQILVVPAGEQSVTYTFTAQATASADPSYAQDVRAMLEGVRVSY